MEIFQRSNTQWRTGPRGAIGLDYGAVWLVAESLGVTMHPANLEKVQALERVALEKMREVKDGK